MANFESIFTGASSQSDLESKINKELATLVISSVVSSSLVQANDGSNKAGLVFALGTGDKLQIKLFKESGIDKLQQTMAGWIEGADVELVQLAITYASNDTRAMLIYKSLVSGSGYSVTGISDGDGSDMQKKVDTAIEDSSEVVSDSTYGGGNYRTMLITK